MTVKDLPRPEDLPVVVAGAGLAGLTAALFLARAGKRVILLEQSAHAGGRAISRIQAGWTFNLGPHALYRGAVGMPILKELGVEIQGKIPVARGLYGVSEGRLIGLDAGLLTGKWLRLGEKLGLGGFLAGVMRLKASDYARVTTRDWLAPIQAGHQRQLIDFLVRVSTYAADFDQLSAEIAIMQLQAALKANVLYLEGGWQSLVDRLTAQALAMGVELHTGKGLAGIERQGDSWYLQLRQGEPILAAGLVLALPPQAVSQLLAPWPELALHASLKQLKPVQAACLDLALNALPLPRNVAAFGLDEASYLSVHSATVPLAPPGGALVHAAWYLKDPEDPALLRTRLEARLDLLQPGWRAQVAQSYFYPHLNVNQALVTAAGGGLAGRTPVRVAGLPGLCLAGDWVGPSGWLADGALASGKAAAHELQAALQSVRASRAAVAA